MKTIDFLNTPHPFHKINLVTKFDSKRRSYDEYKCEKCGIEGKRFGLSEYITITKNYSDELINNCIYLPKEKKTDEFLGKLIRITPCNVNNPQFKNLTPGSIHRIVMPPENYINGDKGVWVMGIGEPVKVLNQEFNFITYKRRR